MKKTWRAASLSLILYKKKEIRSPVTGLTNFPFFSVKINLSY
ncbi:hypothetical protein J2T12_000179 [Paenibacillus anaericanus]|nr:hypothetical protein [Paenibacillus anaericanus]